MACNGVEQELVYLGVNPIKQLIKHFIPPGENELSMYRAMLSDCLNIPSSLQAVSILNDGNVKRYYHMEEEHREPQYFSIQDPKTLVHLGKLLNACFVIYQLVEDKLFVVFDSRLTYLLADPKTSGGAGEEACVSTFVIKTVKETMGFNLYKVPSPLAKRWLDQNQGYSFFMEECAPPCWYEGCFLKRVKHLMLQGGEVPTTTQKDKDKDPPWTLFQVLMRSKCVLEAVGGSPFMIVSYEGTRLKNPRTNASTKARKLLLCERQRFKLLSLYYEGQSIPWKDMTVLGVAPNGYVYKLTRRMSSYVKTANFLKPSKTPLKRARAWPEDKEPEAYESSQQYSKMPKLDMIDDPEFFPAEKNITSPCCEVCESAKDYEKNMSSKGPQTCYKIKYDILFMLKLFNQNTRENVKAVLDCCRMSIGSVDIESSTGYIHNPSLSGRSSVMPHHKVSEYQVYDEERTAIQRILLIGYLDGVSKVTTKGEEEEEEEDEDSDASTKEDYDKVKIFDVGQDQNNIQATVDRFITFLIDRRLELQVKKRSLLDPLFRFVDAYKECHISFFASRFVSEEEAKKSWSYSLLGHLESSLLQLCARLQVFGFNASRYDYVLLAPYFLSSSCLDSRGKSYGGAWKMSRNGSSVRTMRLGHISFLDISKLISPGASLARFAQSVNLTMTKGLCPFQLLDPEGKFLEEPELPADAEAYWSDLSRSTPTQAEVDDARMEYDKLGFTCVREWLYHYLRKDVILLLHSAILYMDTLRETFQSHPVDCHKFTLSSFSNFCAQMTLVRQKRVGCFVPNVALLYAHIKRSMLGGISLVARTAAGMGFEGHAPCNNHLRGLADSDLDMDEHEKMRQREPPSFTQYYDIASLYPASG